MKSGVTCATPHGAAPFFFFGLAAGCLGLSRERSRGGSSKSRWVRVRRGRRPGRERGWGEPGVKEAPACTRAPRSARSRCAPLFLFFSRSRNSTPPRPKKTAPFLPPSPHFPCRRRYSRTNHPPPLHTHIIPPFPSHLRERAIDEPNTPPTPVHRHETHISLRVFSLFLDCRRPPVALSLARRNGGRGNAIAAPLLPECACGGSAAERASLFSFWSMTAEWARRREQPETTRRSERRQKEKKERSVAPRARGRRPKEALFLPSPPCCAGVAAPSSPSISLSPDALVACPLMLLPF